MSEHSLSPNGGNSTTVSTPALNEKVNSSMGTSRVLDEHHQPSSADVMKSADPDSTDLNPKNAAALDPLDSHQNAYPYFKDDKPWSQRSWWYELMPFRGMYYDIRRRLPFLASDWTTAFRPNNWWYVLQYIPRMYFINLMPAISYIIDMNHRTDGAYGLNEVILASALVAIVFPIFSIQPLTFVGVTGLINLVNYTQYNIVVEYYGLDRMDYLRVQAWSLIWAAGFHFVVALFNLCDFTRFITDMTSQTFGFYVGIVYIQKGIELLILEYEPAPLDNATGWLSVTIAILFTVSVYLVTKIGSTSVFPFQLRYFISSFAFAAGCIFWTGFSHFPKNSLERVPIERLPITKSFFPSIDRSWFIDFWNIETRWIFVGAPLGFLIMLLFYFDHNVSSVMAQARQFPVKRPAGFHWDFFLLGITTLISGFLGLPAPNGLVPQCPWSTESLSVYKQEEVSKDQDEERPLMGKRGKQYPRQHIVNTRVVENRVGHLIVGLLTLGTMTRPLLVVLGTMPRALFAGIFLLVGWSSIENNIITTRTIAVFKDRHLASANDPLLQVRRSKIALFVGVQWVFFGMTIAISQTIAAIGFPVIITLLIPFRYFVIPKWFSPLELRILDAPTADADVVLASLGHETEAVTGQGQRVARDTGIAGSEWPDNDDDSHDGRGDLAKRGLQPYDEVSNHDQRNNTLVHRDGTDVQGYTIEDESDGQENLADDKDPSLDVDPDGHYRAWIDKNPIQEKQTYDQANADDFGSKQESFAGRPKDTKRNKSVTQSWWGLGGDQPVDRAPTPHTPVSHEGPSGIVPALQDQATVTNKNSQSTEGKGFGLSSLFKGKQKSIGAPDKNKSFQDEARSQPSQTYSEQPNVETLKEDFSNEEDNIPTSAANLFLGGGRSPSEAGAAAAFAVRGLQSGSSLDKAPKSSSEIAMPSNIPMIDPHAMVGHISSSGAPLTDEAALQHNAFVNIAPTLSRNSQKQDKGPGGHSTAHVSSVQPDTPKISRQQRRAKEKEQKQAARLQKKEEKQLKKDEDRRRRDEAQLKREEVEIQSLLTKQAKEREARESKKLKLEREIRDIENRVKAKKSAESIIPLPPKVSKSALTSLSGQVAGHEAGVYTMGQGAFVVKPCLTAESDFYHAVAIKNPRLSKPQLALLKRLKTFLPTYHGMLDIVADEDDNRPSGSALLSRAVILENLTREFKRPNVLDIKLGKQLWDESATLEKRERMDASAKSTTSGITGIRLTGWQTWDYKESRYVKVNKAFGKGIQADQLEVGLRAFLGLGSELDSKVVSELIEEPIEAPKLPAKHINILIEEGILPALKEVVDILKKFEWRVRGGSLLIVYEGDPSVLQNVDAKSELRPGRRIGQGDEVFDANELDQIHAEPIKLRDVDLRLIDFAHASFTSGQGRDDGYLAGLETTMSLMQKLSKDIRKGRITDNYMAEDEKARSSADVSRQENKPHGLFSVFASKEEKGNHAGARSKDQSRETSNDDARAVEETRHSRNPGKEAVGDEQGDATKAIDKGKGRQIDSPPISGSVSQHRQSSESRTFENAALGTGAVTTAGVAFTALHNSGEATEAKPEKSPALVGDTRRGEQHIDTKSTDPSPINQAETFTEEDNTQRLKHSSLPESVPDVAMPSTQENVSLDNNEQTAHSQTNKEELVDKAPSAVENSENTIQASVREVGELPEHHHRLGGGEVAATTAAVAAGGAVGASFMSSSKDEDDGVEQQQNTNSDKVSNENEKVNTSRKGKGLFSFFKKSESSGKQRDVKQTKDVSDASAPAGSSEHISEPSRNPAIPSSSEILDEKGSANSPSAIAAPHVLLAKAPNDGENVSEKASVARNEQVDSDTGAGLPSETLKSENDEAKALRKTKKEESKAQKLQEKEALRKKQEDAKALEKQKKEAALLMEKQKRDEEKKKKEELKATKKREQQERKEKEAADALRKKEEERLAKEKKKQEEIIAADKLKHEKELKKQQETQEKVLAKEKKEQEDKLALEERRQAEALLKAKKEQEEKLVKDRKELEKRLEKEKEKQEKELAKQKKEQEEKLAQEKKEQEEKLAQEKKEQEEKLAQEKKEQEERLAQEKKQQEERLVQEKKEQEERLAQEKKEQEERLVQEKKEQEEKLAKESEQRIGAEQRELKANAVGGSEDEERLSSEKENQFSKAQKGIVAGAVGAVGAVTATKFGNDEKTKQEAPSQSPSKRRGLGFFGSIKRSRRSINEKDNNHRIDAEERDSTRQHEASQEDPTTKLIDPKEDAPDQDSKKGLVTGASRPGVSGSAAEEHTTSKEEASAEELKPKVPAKSSATSELPSLPDKEAPQTPSKGPQPDKKKNRTSLFGLRKRSTQAAEPTSEGPLQISSPIAKAEALEEEGKPADERLGDTTPATDNANGSTLDHSIPPEILAAIQTGNEPQLSEDTAPSTPKKKPGSAEIASTQKPAVPPKSAWPTPVEHTPAPEKQEHGRFSSLFRSNLAIDPQDNKSTSPSRSLSKKKHDTAQKRGPTVEEVVENTPSGPRKYLVHTNPPRGAGKSASAVQWRNS